MCILEQHMFEEFWRRLNRNGT